MREQLFIPHFLGRDYHFVLNERNRDVPGIIQAIIPFKLSQDVNACWGQTMWKFA